MSDNYPPQDPNQYPQQPPGQYPQQAPPQYQGQYPPQYPQQYATRVPNNGMGVASLVLGILGLVFWLFFGWILSIIAVILGHVAKSQIDKSNGTQQGRGMAIAGLVMGWIGVAFLILLIVLGLLGAASFSFTS